MASRPHPKQNATTLKLASLTTPRSTATTRARILGVAVVARRVAALATVFVATTSARWRWRRWWSWCRSTTPSSLAFVRARGLGVAVVASRIATLASVFVATTRRLVGWLTLALPLSCLSRDWSRLLVILYQGCRLLCFTTPRSTATTR